jgi:ABC-2 type transport system ATP-binding protein
MTAVIRTERLTHSYGRARGVVDLDLEVQAGEVFGFLGPNGAGKTTTIRTILDFIRPTSGRAEVFGLDSHRASLAIHGRIGYLPGEFAAYRNLTGAEFLHYAASLRGGIETSRVDDLAARLDCDLTKRIRALSHGNKQKIGLIQAFMHRPELVILDEPTTGLDPLVQQEFYRLVADARADGSSVFLSSHILPEVEHTCDRVGIIRQGRLLAVETIDALKHRAMRRLEIEFTEPVPDGAFVGLDGVTDIRVVDRTLRCTITGDVDAVIKAAARFHVHHIISNDASLEEIFLAYYGGGTSDAAA